MKFGMTFVNSGPFAEPDLAVTLAQLAEEAGFESLWTVEHVVVPAGYESQYPYSSTGRMPGGEEIPITDPLVWLAYVAHATSRITLGTGIVILPQRNPVILAKEVATLDVLSRGRVQLGVGVGWLREEFDALGVPFEDRAARTEEYIEALRTLWREPEPTFAGRYASFTRAKSYPKPVNGTVPIVVGGHTHAAARRAGRLGDGFFPAKATPQQLAEFLESMRVAAKDAGRDPDTIEITAGGRPDPEVIKAYADLGVSRFVTGPLGFDAETLKRGIGEFAEKIIAAF